MKQPLDLTTLAICDALDLAILVEEEAKDRYEELADQMALHHNDDAARFFLKMVQVELTHEHVLMNKRRARFGDSPRRVTRAMIFDVEAPDYAGARATMTARRALEMALEAEQKAYQFFDDAVGAVSDPEIRAFFTQLRDEELEHQRRVEAEIARLGPDPILSADDVSDPPQAL